MDAAAPTPTPDILGEPWVARRIPVTDAAAAPGADHAVLVHQRQAVPAPGATPRHPRAVLYLHGRNDYFFQTHLAQAFLDAGYEFYALDLRACGRSAQVGLTAPQTDPATSVPAGQNAPSQSTPSQSGPSQNPGQSTPGQGGPTTPRDPAIPREPAGPPPPPGPPPHDVLDLRVHYEEINEALRIIRTEHRHSVVVLNAHSTGGLQAAIWAGDHKDEVPPSTSRVDAVVLNSPWLDFNASAFMRSYGSAAVELLAKVDPGHRLSNPAESAAGADADPRLADPYNRALHARWGGEWNWDLRLKPSPGFPVTAGFIAGIRRLQRDVHHGLGIRVPVLVTCSTASWHPGDPIQDALRADAVLSVERIMARAPFLGQDVTVIQIEGGVHDLVLSPEPARSEYLRTVTTWLAERLP